MLQGSSSSVQSSGGEVDGKPRLLPFVSVDINTVICLQGESGALVNFNLSEYEQMLSQQTTHFYHQVIDIAHAQLKPLIGQ